MFDLPYPVQAAALADRLESCAAAARRRAARLDTPAATCAWDGKAARAFRRSADEALGRLHSAQRHLTAAAQALRRHGAVVQRAIDQRERDAVHLLGRVGIGS